MIERVKNFTQTFKGEKLDKALFSLTFHLTKFHVILFSWSTMLANNFMKWILMCHKIKEFEFQCYFKNKQTIAVIVPKCNH